MKDCFRFSQELLINSNKIWRTLLFSIENLYRNNCPFQTWKLLNFFCTSLLLAHIIFHESPTLPAFIILAKCLQASVKQIKTEKLFLSLSPGNKDIWKNIFWENDIWLKCLILKIPAQTLCFHLGKGTSQFAFFENISSKFDSNKNKLERKVVPYGVSGKMKYKFEWYRKYALLKLNKICSFVFIVKWYSQMHGYLRTRRTFLQIKIIKKSR